MLNQLAQSFILPIRKAPCFQAIEYVSDKKQNDRQLSAAGYNAVVTLSVREISIDRTAGNNVSLDILVHGEMKSPPAGKIVWSHEEYVTSSGHHSLDYLRTTA